MRLHWLAIGILTGSALFAQPMPPYPPQGQQGYPPPQQNGAPQNSGAVDAPGRAVARLGILNGDASVRRGDSSDWVAAAVNAPLMSGDEISVAAGGRAELELDASHFLRLGGDTEVRLADLENGHFQVQLAHGTATWRVLRNGQSQGDLSTPLVSVHPGALSTVRVEVSPDGTSHVTVRKGEADVSTEKGSEKVSENTTMDVRGSANDPEFQVVAAAQHDEWDNWNDQRDTFLLRSQSQRYVTSDVQGVEDLDAYGRWNYDPAYGWVWMPSVAANWAPYQDGQWVWEDYYGWTWVDYAPWGWAPFHYGNWYFRTGLGWAWWPGSRIGHVWWRPAMVGFFGWGGGVGVGVGFGFGFANIGWIPLAPHEAFYPWYGRGAVGVNMVRNGNVMGTFRNASALHGVTAVSAADFQRGNFRNTVAVDRATLSQASLARGAVPMTPTNQNLRFSQRSATVSGSPMGQRFFGSSATPAAARRTPFVQQQANVRSEMSRPMSTPQTQNNWNRFQSTPAGATPSARGAAPANRYTPQQNAAPQQRQVQVSPQIVRQRPESTPSYTPQARPQAPAPRGESRPAPRAGNGGRR